MRSRPRREMALRKAGSQERKGRRIVPWAVLAIVVVVFGVAASARAQGSLFLRGARAYAEGRYADAAVMFSDAYAADHDPTYLVHLGRALDGAGDPEGALEAYTTWLELEPDAPERAEIEDSMARLRIEIAAHAGDETTDEIVPDETEETDDAAARHTPAPLVAPSANGPRISPWPWVIVSGGVILFVAGAITGGFAADAHGAADRAPSHDVTVARENEAQSQATAATVLLVLGGLITLGGGAWGVYDIVSENDAAEDTAAADRTTARLRLGPTSASLDVEF